MLLLLLLLTGVRAAGSVTLGADTAAVDCHVSVVACRCTFMLIDKSIAAQVVCKIVVADVAVGAEAILVPAACGVAAVGGASLLHMVSS